jgi:D-beta-D-heptose 7-phosphate kinase/D-beta-D-heptose 1-phosphate adenosyltransferase
MIYGDFYYHFHSNMTEKIVCVSGYFNPIHVGHLELLERAKALGDKLYVIVNNDKQSILKKGTTFMAEGERIQILRALRCVDAVVLSCDEDRTVCKSLRMIRPHIFANGGDVTEGSSCPEEPVCKELGIEMVYGLGSKVQSSSWLIEGSSQKKQKTK